MNEDMLIAITEAYYLKSNRSARLTVPSSGPNMENSSTLTISNASTASSGSGDKTRTDNVEKEKKRKGLSASRSKKFYRHFQQLSTDEQVINCEYYEILDLVSPVEYHFLEPPLNHSRFYVSYRFFMCASKRHEHATSRASVHYQELFCFLLKHVWLRDQGKHD